MAPTNPTTLATRARDENPTPKTRAGALARMVEAEETLRAIGAGEIDAFVVSDGGSGQRVFTLVNADRPYRMFVENMRDGAATLSSGGLILYANRRLAELLASSRDEIVGSAMDAFVDGDVSMTTLAGRDALGSAVELDLVDSNGARVPVVIGISPLDLDGERLTCLTFTDLSAQRAQDREIARLGQAQAERMADLQAAQVALTKQATHDALTGLPNRALLVDRIDQALFQSRRNGRFTAVLFVDLDEFKQVNDTHGHAAGDALLRDVADRLVTILRPMDTVARIGGDEFVVLAPDIKSRADAVDMSVRLVSELSLRRDSTANPERVAASVGLAIDVGGAGTAESLLHEADTAMYKAKSRGGARAEAFGETLGRQVEARAVVQRALQAALDDDRVVVHYQPIIDLSAGRIVGFEALARITDQDGTIMLPSSFIPTAEETGLVIGLGAKVLASACEQARLWQPRESSDDRLTVAVNISARQFDAGDLATTVSDALKRTSLHPSCLHLELTETAIFELRPEILDQLARVRDLGVQIGLDDFGTGYASFTHLRDLPLSFVKIDKSFVHGLNTNQENDRIVAAVADLASNLGLRSIAEGIETQEQRDRLQELGCDQGQGFLLGRPIEPQDVPRVLRDPPS